MYMEMDGDDIAITYIKDVTFNTNLPNVEILKMTKPPFVMEKWIVGIEKYQTVECIVTYENDVRTPKTTKHIQTVEWSKGKVPDEVRSVQLVIQTSLPNSEGNTQSRSNSNIDCQWMNSVRMRHMVTSSSLQHSRSHSPSSVTSYLPYLQNQETYAAALRRTRVSINYQITPISNSRSSSPTQYGLATNLSSLHLNSKGSSTSSVASDSPSERDRAAKNSKNVYCGRGSRSLSVSGRYSGRSSQITPSAPRHSGKPYRTFQSTSGQSQHVSRSYDHRKHIHYPQQPKSIPGMPLKAESISKGEEESKVSDDGWVKVDYSKKSHRQGTGKPNRERIRGTGRGQKRF
uniref:Uncharacterized protein n=1 Tax=Sphenodon punctatus TaxID=8508 RepID=A0A8D0G9K4_SPHPU